MRNRIIKFSIIIFLFPVFFIFISKFIDIPFIGIESEKLQVWCIGIYKILADKDELKIFPHPRVNNPVLTAKDITDRKAVFIADPFLIYKDGSYYIFFEVLSQDNSADIGLGTSQNGIKWEYQKIILDEPFHLSYPYVFKLGRDFYMVPESSEDKSVRLYKAEYFPYKWNFVRKLIEGRSFSDPTILHYQNRWWLFVSTVSNENLFLYYADSLEGPWQEHPKSPVVVGDANTARCGGNIIDWEGRLIRIAQDDFPSYGNSIRAFEIVKLDTEEFAEKELKESPLLSASGKGWNKDGMHQLSVCQADDKELIASVDGNRNKEKHRFYIELPEVLGKFLERLIK